MKNNKGFTLIELMIVIVILALLSIAAISEVETGDDEIIKKEDTSEIRRMQ